MRGETGQPPGHEGERDHVDGRSCAAHDRHIGAENGRQYGEHDRDTAEKGEIDPGLFRQAQSQFHCRRSVRVSHSARERMEQRVARLLAPLDCLKPRPFSGGL